MKACDKTCSCPETIEVDGKRYPLTLDVDCRQHSYPSDKWRAGSPLFRHALKVEKSTGIRFPRHEAYALAKDAKGVVYGENYQRLFRTETPREVEARLLADAEASRP